MAIAIAKLGMWSTVALTGVGGVTAVVTDGFSDMSKLTSILKPAAIEQVIEKPAESVALLAEPAKTEGTDSAKPQVETPALENPAPENQDANQPKIKAPAFDVMRVEADGSILVAGSAEPNATVELVLNDGNVIGSAKTGAEGDFVILPEKALEPGDYVLTLKAIIDDGNGAISGQQGVVQVPEPGGEVLAMISEEGKPSRIIAKPTVVEPTIVAKEPAVENTEVSTDEVPNAAPSVQEEVVKPAEIAKAEPAEVVKTSTDKVSIAQTEIDTEDSPTTETEVPKVVSTDQPKDELKPDTTVAKLDEEETVEQVSSGEAITKQPVEPTKRLPAPAQVIVEAVEVEGRKVFVAGAVPKGVPVRIYIDNKLLGTVRGTLEDRFFLAKDFDLTTGEHTIRADVISTKDGTVLSRAEVPLLHEGVQQIASETSVVETPKVPVPSVPDQKPVEVASIAPTSEQPPVNAVPQVEQKTAVEKVEQEAPDLTEEPKVQAVADDRPKIENEPVEKTVSVNPTKATKVVSDEVIIDKPEAKTATNTPTAVLNNVTKPAAVEQSVTTDQVPQNVASPELVDTKQPVVELAKATPSTLEPKPQNAEPIQVEKKPIRVLKTGKAIIIKPGDNLWRISRHTYGRGVRYTTIYNANKEQIRDPNRIYIGQIFKIPDQHEPDTDIQ